MTLECGYIQLFGLHIEKRLFLLSPAHIPSVFTNSPPLFTTPSRLQGSNALLG
jgi:hypothetical protein